MIQNESTKEIASLTGFRALAAVMVWFSHIALNGIARYPILWVFRYGQTGVDFFFALSGFLFTVLYFDKRFDKKNLFAYFIKRITRIYPTYWLVMAIALLLGMVNPSVFMTPPFSPIDFLLNTFLLQGYFRSTVHAYLEVAWTLTVEELFYACFPIILVFIKSYCVDKTKSRISLLKVVVFLAGIIFLEMQLWSRFMNFASGIIGGLLVIQYPRSKWINDKWLNSLLGVVGIVIFGFAVFSNQFNILNGLNEYLAVCLNYFLTFGVSGTLIILSLYGNSWLRKVFENKVMVYGGKISFAFYLIHIHVFTYLKDPLLAVIESITGKGINRLPANILVVFVIFLVTGLLSAFIYERIERPVQTYLRSLWLQEKRYQPKPSF